MAVKSAERKQWARENFVGLQNIVAPSFRDEMSTLDEEGIRLDVRQSIRHGFFGSLLSCDAGQSLEENKRFVEIAADEAGDELLIGVSLFVDNQDQMIQLAEHAEKVGADFALMGFPVMFSPETEDEVYDHVRKICDATNLGIIIPAWKEKVDMTRFHPGGAPFTLYDRLVQIDNVSAIQVASMETGLITECFMRYQDKVPVSCNFFGMIPLIEMTVGQQWTGGWYYEALQSPDFPLAVEFFDLVRKKQMDQAMKLYWRMAPGIATQHKISEMFRLGPSDHFHLRKYYQWMVGGNGSLTRQPHMNLFERQKEWIRESYLEMGIRPTPDSEEMFFVGRSGYDEVVPSVG